MEEKEQKKITEKIEDTSKKIDSIMHNRLIIAIFMILDGINFILNPVQSVEMMAQTIACFAFIASGASLITNIKNRDTKSIIFAIAMIIISICTFVFPKVFALNLRGLIGIFIIINGLINIFNIIKLDKVSTQLLNTENKRKDKFDNNETDQSFNKGVILEQTGKVINPINNVIEKSSNKSSVLYFALNVLSIILGLFLFTSKNVTLVVCGLILIYSGSFDLLMFIKSYKLSKNKKILLI